MVIRCALLQAVRRAFLMNASPASPEWGLKGGREGALELSLLYLRVRRAQHSGRCTDLGGGGGAVMAVLPQDFQPLWASVS